MIIRIIIKKTFNLQKIHGLWILPKSFPQYHGSILYSFHFLINSNSLSERLIVLRKCWDLFLRRKQFKPSVYNILNCRFQTFGLEPCETMVSRFIKISNYIQNLIKPKLLEFQCRFGSGFDSVLSICAHSSNLLLNHKPFIRFLA